MVVQHHHGAGAEPAAGFFHRGEIHLHVQVLLDQEVRGRAAGQQAPEGITVAQAAGVRHEDLARRRAQGQFPQPRIPHPAADAIELRAALLRRAAQ